MTTKLDALRLQALMDTDPGAAYATKGQLPGLRITVDGNKGSSHTVENFLRMRTLVGTSGTDAEIGASLRKARVFHIEQLTYANFYHQVDVWVEKTCYGQEWAPAVTLDGKRPHSPDGKTYVEGALKLIETANGLEMIELPFPDVYYGFGSGIGLAANHIEMRDINLDWDILDAKLMALHVIDNGRQVYEHIQCVCDDGNTRLVSYPCRHVKEEEEGIAAQWRGPAASTLTPWVLYCLVSAAESHAKPGNRLVATREVKRHQKRTGERMKPPQWYTVRTTTVLDKTIADEVMAESTMGASPSYRFDVRGHWRLLTKRDSEALLTKDRLALESRGYVIGANANELGPDIVQAMLDRGLALPKDGAWVACRLVRVKEHQKGPEDGGYIQAVRTA